MYFIRNFLKNEEKLEDEHLTEEYFNSIFIDEMISTIFVGLSIGFSRSYGGRFYHVMKLDTPTDSTQTILDTCMLIFDRYYNNEPIRMVGVSCGGLVDKESIQLNLFESIEEEEKESKKDKTIDEITSKYGKNSLVRASALLSDSTALERNKKIGGHNA